MAEDQENRLVGSRYVLEKRLDRGGMGAVWSARDQHDGTPVAVKLIHPELARDGSLRERFRREAMAAAALNHPNIARTLDFGREQDGLYWMAMEYLDGEKLSDAIDREAPIAQRRVVFIAAQILDALAATHEAGIVHRDLKPPNIVLTRIAGVKDAVKLVDFGVAKLMESEAYQRMTRTGQIVGTPSFMAPEQARGEHIDGRADLYALGVVMYVCLAKRLPYEFENNAELLVAIQDQEPVPLPEIAAAVQPELWTTVIRPALAKDPAARFESAAAMQAALKPFVKIRTDELQQIRVHEIAAAEARPRPSHVPAPAELARTRPSRTSPHQALRKKSPLRHPVALAAILVVVVAAIVVAALGVFAFLELTFGARGDAPPATPPPALAPATPAQGAQDPPALTGKPRHETSPKPPSE